MENPLYEFDVALSFAGKDRPYIEKVVKYLRQYNINMFYDDDELVNLWGKNLLEYLEDVYRRRSRYVVLFISKNYKKSEWCNHELESALKTAFAKDREFILPVRFDDTKIKGIPKETGYIDLRDVTPKNCARLIYKKVRCNSSKDDVNLIPTDQDASDKRSVNAKFRVEAIDGTVFFYGDKYKKNSTFCADCNFYMLIGADPIKLLQIEGLYYARGCPSLPRGRGQVSMNGQGIGLFDDGNLEKQPDLAANERIRIRFGYDYGPPLMRMNAADCDNGDLQVVLSWRTNTELETMKTELCFRYDDAGSRKMSLVDSLRPPPRLNQEELERFNRENKITDQQLSQLLEIDPIDRYTLAFSDNTTSWRLSNMSYELVKLIRGLVGNYNEPEL